MMKKKLRINLELFKPDLDIKEIVQRPTYPLHRIPSEIKYYLTEDIDGNPIERLMAKDVLTYELTPDANGNRWLKTTRHFYSDYKFDQNNELIHAPNEDTALVSEQLPDQYLSINKAADIKKDGRNGIINALVETITDPQLSAIIKQIIGWYATAIDLFIKYGHLDILDAIQNETLPERTAILDIKPFESEPNHPLINKTISDLVVDRFAAYKTFIETH